MPVQGTLETILVYPIIYVLPQYWSMCWVKATQRLNSVTQQFQAREVGWKGYNPLVISLFEITDAQSICTQSPNQSASTILVLKTWVGLWPWKKSGPKYGPEKIRLQKTGSLLFKKRRSSCPLLFLNNNDPVNFLHPAFCNPYFEPFFRFTNWPLFSKQE